MDAETRDALARLEGLSARLAIMHELAEDLMPTGDLDGIIALLRRRMKWLLDYDHVSLSSVDDGVLGEPRLIHGVPALGTFSSEPGRCGLSRAVRTGVVQVERDAEQGLLGPGSSQMIIPIKGEKQAIATLNLSRHPGQPPYTAEDLRVGSLLGLQLSAAARNIQHAQEQQRLNRDLEAARVQLEHHLFDILPAPVARQLIQEGEVPTRRIEQATVLFTDFADFTTVATRLDPTALVTELDTNFRAFDLICSRFGLERVKTIGDSYMAVAGVLEPDPDPALRAVRAAFEMRAAHQDWCEGRKRLNLPTWGMRVGLHTGPLVAGIVGKQRRAFDVWGDTVNVASRVESTGQDGEVRLSDATCALVRDRIRCEDRGLVEARHRGWLHVWAALDELAPGKDHPDPA